MAKSKEELLEQLYASRQHSTLKDLEDALAAYGFIERPHRKQSGNTHVWQLGSCVVTLHRPHKKFAGGPGQKSGDVGAESSAFPARRADASVSGIR